MQRCRGERKEWGWFHSVGVEYEKGQRVLRNQLHS